MSNKIKVLDLFSGIGGFSLGLEMAGMETVAFCEVDKHCQKVLRKHWPDVRIYDDVRALNGGRLIEVHGQIDLICGGFPCQDISVAGPKKGLKDDSAFLQEIEREFTKLFDSKGRIGRDAQRSLSELSERCEKASKRPRTERTRSGLWEEFKRLINEVKPRYAIIENVANLRNLGLNQIIKDLGQIGYDCEWHIISARSIGAPHLRERIWIIAHANGHAIRLEQRGSSGQKGEREIVIGDDGQEGDATDPSGERLERSGITSRVEAQESINCYNANNIPNTNLQRCWKPFASEKEASRWWAEATSSFSDWWQTESPIYRVDDGLPNGLDKLRREAVKQLGNSVVPFIPFIIGRELVALNES